MSQPNQLNPTIQNETIFDGALAGGDAWSSKPLLKVEGYTNDTAEGVRQGLVNVNMNRASTNALATWDGNKDIGMKINAYNYAANGTNGGIEGLEILARNTGTGATNALVKGMNVTAENKTGAGQVTSMQTAMFTLKNNGVVATSNYGVEIQDESQGTNPTATALLRFSTSAVNPASGAVPAAINIASKNTAGITNLIYAESETLDCATIGNGTYSTAEGYFTIKVGANTYRIPFFSGTDA